MTKDNHDHDTYTEDQILEKAENFLNFQFDRTGIKTEVDRRRGFFHIVVMTSGGRNTESETYKLQACPVCGNIQPMNWTAFKKWNPVIAKDLLREARRGEAEKYIETGELPDTNEEVINRLERRNLRWDNNFCEQRHPPASEVMEK